MPMTLEREVPASGRRRFRRAAALAGLLTLASGLLAAAAPAALAAPGAAHAAKSSQVGWIRLTHLSPSTPPVLSTSVHVAPGAAYTVAGLGPAKGLRLAVLHDRLTTPRGKSLVRVIQASLRDHKVTVTAGSQVLAHQLAFGNVTSYRAAHPGTWTVHVAGAAGVATAPVTLAAGTIHTLVVLDGS